MAGSTAAEGCRMNSGLHMIARYQCKLRSKLEYMRSIQSERISTHCSLIGTTMYFFLNRSSLDVHFLTL